MFPFRHGRRNSGDTPPCLLAYPPGVDRVVGVGGGQICVVDACTCGVSLVARCLVPLSNHMVFVLLVEWVWDKPSAY